MMKISQHIFLAALAALAASCSSDNLPETLSGNGEKTPITIAATIGDNSSRAYDKTFEQGDKLLAMLRQVKWNGSEVADYSQVGVVSGVNADSSPRLVTLTVDDGFAMSTVDTDTEQTDDITPTDTPLYWDDFSDSSSDETDLRTAGHYLQSAWGFCFNGGTPTTALNNNDGTVGWTAAADFTAAGTMKSNDLLWSKAQKPISYNHNARETLTIPYTHAMSMITIEITAGDGFAATGAFDLTEVKLQAMWEKAVFTAPSATVGSQENAREVKMSKNEMAGNKYVFQALVIPGKQLTAGNVLANITNIDGNNYQIPITAEILSPEKWGAKLDEGKLMPGVHYKLTVGVAKQGIDVVAQITNWTVVNAEGTGIIVFDPDVTTEQTNTLKGTFDLYRSTSTAGLGSLAFATLCSYADPEWSCNPAIYWENSSTSYYFRALATLEADGKLKSRSTTVGVEGENARTAAAQGKDLMWATTKAHNGTAADGSSYSYDAGAAIRPRTGDVPLQFEHAMSKITINLSTSTTGILLANQSLDQQARAVDFTNATISISNLCTAGTIAIANGNITPTELSVEAPTSLQQNVTTEIKDKGSISEIVIPQSLLEKTIGETGNCPIKLTITLGDGTTYSLLLKDCKVKDSADNYITTWNRGTHYVYEIYVEKEAIRFVAVIKEWEKVNGSGDANLDWD